MGDILDFSEDLIEDLKTERDILKVQMHLAKAEAKDEWARLEKKWDKIAAESKKLGEVVQETASEAKVDLKILADDLLAGYKKMRKSLED